MSNDQTKAEEPLTCPMRTMSRGMAKDMPCLRERCAWWFHPWKEAYVGHNAQTEHRQVNGQCSIRLIARQSLGGRR